MGNKHRLERLERACGVRDGCPECGVALGWPITITFAEQHRLSHKKPRSCSTCKLPSSFTFSLALASSREDLPYE